MEQKTRPDLSSAALRLLAMGLMLCDHMWAMLFPAAEWLTCLGRAAFPIFAFLAAEGYAHTKDLRRYLLRMLCWAVLSEVPFNLMYGGDIFCPFHQNVLWTFLLSLLLIALIERGRARLRPAEGWLLAGLLSAAGYVLGCLTMVDYYGAGVLTVLMFYFLRGRGWKRRVLQLLCMYVLNVSVLGGYYYDLQILGRELQLVQQGLALLALIPIWLYRGRQGLHNKAFQVFCYAFYPVHILALLAVRAWMLR